jgi:hypothetical protein
MCNITNNQASTTLSRFRQIDEKGISSFNDQELAEALVLSDSLYKEVETYTKALKSAALERGLEIMLPEYESKLVLVEQTSSKVNAAMVFEDYQEKRLTPDEFLDLISIVAKKAETPAQKESVANATEKVPGARFIQVKPLTKKDRENLLKG